MSKTQVERASLSVQANPVFNIFYHPRRLDARIYRTYHSVMLANLDQLADGIQQLASLVERLREENRSLRLELVEAKSEARSLQARLNAARARIEAVIERLPTDG